MTQTQNVPPLIESDETDYRDSGVPSTVAIAGHPIHPVIVTIPIALWVVVPVADLLYWWTNDLFWAKGSFWLLVGGLAVAVLAAITGLIDFLRIERVRKRSAGWAHMALNVLAMLLTIFNIVLRWGNPAGGIVPTGLILSVVVALLLGLSGWFGGELVYRHKVAVIGYGDSRR